MESESINADDLEVPHVDKNNWLKTIENTVLHLKFMRGRPGKLCWTM